ncbi:hypothetical protein IC582_029274 [Cucumis melo]
MVCYRAIMVIYYSFCFLFFNFPFPTNQHSHIHYQTSDFQLYLSFLSGELKMLDQRSY